MSSAANGRTRHVHAPSSREDAGQIKETSVGVKVLNGTLSVKEEAQEVQEDDIPSKKAKLDDVEVASLSSSNGYEILVLNTNIESEKEEENVPARGYRAKRTEQDVEKRQTRCKLFREEWLTIDIFRDWLDRDPTNPRKARCVACNTTMNAGKSELEKHAAGARHERALDAMLQSISFQQLTAAADCENEGSGEVLVCEEDESMTGSSSFGNPDSVGDIVQPVVIEENVHPVEALEQPEEPEVPNRVGYGDALNRMAHAVEHLSSNVSLLLERLAAQHESYLELVKHVHEKPKS